jgi:hypothetical protein
MNEKVKNINQKIRCAVYARKSNTKISTFPTSLKANILYYIPSTLSDGKIINDIVNQISITIYGYNGNIASITVFEPYESIEIPTGQVFSSSVAIRLRGDI